MYAQKYFTLNFLSMKYILLKNFQTMVIYIYSLCMGGRSLIISDQEDENIWKILAMENLLPDNHLLYNMEYYCTIAFEEKLHVVLA